LILSPLQTVEENQAPEEARYLLTRTRQEVTEQASRAIIEMILTIMVYKFEQLSRLEVESMLGITLKETRVYREIKEEGREEATVNLIIRQITKRFGELSGEMRSSIADLPLPVLEDLSEALLDFTSSTDLQAWLNRQ
jgi:predicted transposase YdaD